MNRWVYRRPLFRANKPKIPLTRPIGGVHVRRRKPFFARRRHVVHSKAASVVALLVFTATVVKPMIPRRKPQVRPPQRVGNRDRIIIPKPFEGKQGPIIRMFGAVRRIRFKMYQRLRWKPRPEEIPPIFFPSPGHGDNRGSVFSAGAVAADIYSAGAKRGSIFDG